MLTLCEPVIGIEEASFMQSGVSIVVGSCDVNNVPSIARAVGCTVSTDRQEVAVFLPQLQAGAVLKDMAAREVMAVVFSEPSTHRAIQVKGRKGALSVLDRHDLSAVEQYRSKFVSELMSIGVAEPFASTLLACPLDELIKVRFLPFAAFLQTPGSQAGTPLKNVK